MPKILIGADVGGTKTAVAVSEDGKILGRADGPGGAVRPGRALVAATTITEVVRRAMSAAGRLTADVMVVGAAGAGREPEREELRKALRAENIAADVAALAPHVLTVAADGDQLARGITDYAARELSQLAICLLPKMELTPPVPVAVTGGLLVPDQPLRRALLAKLREESAFQPTDTPVDAVAGALQLAASVEL